MGPLTPGDYVRRHLEYLQRVSLLQRQHPPRLLGWLKTSWEDEVCSRWDHLPDPAVMWESERLNSSSRVGSFHQNSFGRCLECEV